MFRTRFAPSPTGYLHLGHAYSAMFAFREAQRSGGKFILRIEDIDPIRCKLEFSEAILEDLQWLGIQWEIPVRKQSQHMDDYAEALDHLRKLDVLYPCFCTRKEIAAEAAASAHAPHGVDGVIYPGTCRHLSQRQRSEKLIEHQTANWRLDVTKALSMTGPLSWHDQEHGMKSVAPEVFGDVVLARKDVPTSYHLSVTVDDHLQNVTLVTRGEDLRPSTDIHRLIQALLGYATPDYHHHAVLLDNSGKRYAKRDQAVTLRQMRGAGADPKQLLHKIGF